MTQETNLRPSDDVRGSRSLLLANSDEDPTGCCSVPLSDNTHESSLSGRYGSTGTLSTAHLPSSASSSTESSPTFGSASGQQMMDRHRHHLSIEMQSASTTSNNSEETYLISSDSLSSSSDGRNDDDDDHNLRTRRRRSRLSRLKSRTYQTAMHIENAYLTLSNFKVAVSFVLWWFCYMFMGIFGGAVAYLHFPRTAKETPAALPDFGYDMIPYHCPAIPHVPHGNVQSVVLFVLYAIIFCGVVLRWTPKYHNITGERIRGTGDGRLILQQLYHLNCLIFLTRTSTVVMTGLPQPNPKCTAHQHYAVTFKGALAFVVGRGFPPHACGDLIYSGHVGCTLICMAVLHRHGFLRRRITAILVWAVAVVGIYFTIACRSHYTVDVVLALYFGYFLPEWYFLRSRGVIKGRMARMIRWIEVRPDSVAGKRYPKQPIPESIDV